MKSLRLLSPLVFCILAVGFASGITAGSAVAAPPAAPVLLDENGLPPTPPVPPPAPPPDSGSGPAVNSASLVDTSSGATADSSIDNGDSYNLDDFGCIAVKYAIGSDCESIAMWVGDQSVMGEENAPFCSGGDADGSCVCDSILDNSVGSVTVNAQCFSGTGQSGDAGPVFTRTFSTHQAPSWNVTAVSSTPGSSSSAPLNDVQIQCSADGTATGNISWQYRCDEDEAWVSDGTQSDPGAGVITHDFGRVCDYGSEATYKPGCQTTRGAIQATRSGVVIVGVPAWPTAETTGITDTHCPDWDATKRNTSGRTITTAGATISYEQISGPIRIQAPNVTLKCVKIDARGSSWALRCSDSSCSNFLLEDAELYGADCVDCEGPLVGLRPGAVYRRIHLRGGPDHAKLDAGLLEDSYLPADYFEVPGVTHNDAIQSQGTEGQLTLRHNFIAGPYKNQNAALQFESNSGRIENVLAENNMFFGGSFTVYLRNEGAGNPNNIVFRNNVWVKDSYTYWPLSSDISSSECSVWENNTFEDGSPVPGPSGAKSSGTCP